MNDDLAQLRRVLHAQRRQSFMAAAVDVLMVGTLTAFGSMAVLIVLKHSLTFSAIPALLAAYAAWRRPVSLDHAASDLDRRHDLADLLSSAWAVRDRDEPWAESLRSIANARAAALPPSPWPGRWTIRRCACGLAMAGATLLLTQLIPTPSARADTKIEGQQMAAPNTPAPQFIAEARQRPADTAGSETRLPSEHDSAANGQAASHPTQSPSKDSPGQGQADSRDRSAMQFASTAEQKRQSDSTAGGHRVSEIDAGPRRTGGTVQSEPGRRMDQPIESKPAPTDPAPNERPAAPLPAGYRELVSEYFAR